MVSVLSQHCVRISTDSTTNKNEPANFVEQLSRSRVYQDYQKAFGKTTKLPLALSPIDTGWEIYLTRSTHQNPFCAILAPTNKVCAHCLELQRTLRSTNISDTQTVRCFAGLAVSSVPVKLKERVIAFLQTGPVFLRAPSANRFKKIATRLISWGIKVNLARLETAYLHSRVVSPSLYHGAVRLLEIFAEHLALIANQIALQQANVDSPIVGRAKDYVASHQSEPIKLEQIARALNVSTFHFCRMFKQTTGLTFTDYLSRVRIEKAKILLYNNRLRVSEIAYEVGFQTITHFNRIFRKLVGYSPTEYRSRLAGIC
jgi:AraC-like DNA-binding protein/ligand-binding sensor protein